MMNPDERALRELNATWIAAVNAGDLPRLHALMADDVVFLNPGGPPIGREGFDTGFLAGHAQGRLACASEVEEVVVAGDVAYTRCRDAVSMTPHAGGEALRFAGYRLTVYRRQADGRWLLARDAHTVGPVDAPRGRGES